MKNINHDQRTPPTTTVALVEDEPVLREELAFQLQHRGFDVVAFADAAGLYRHLAVHNVAALVLDIGLPGEDGLSVARLLRAHHPLMGLVFVTARHLRHDRLEGLSAGADAYLSKPVDVDELELLLRRLLQRHTATSTPVTTPPDDSSAPHWQLLPIRNVLQAPNGTHVRLTLTELQFLSKLISQPGQPCSNLDLAQAMNLMPDEWSRHRMEVVVSRLRNKVERETGLPIPIKTVRGTGYAWTD